MNNEISTTDARREFGEVINRVACGRERVQVTHRGRALAAIVPIEDLELLERLEDHVDVQAARKALKEKGAITLDELISRHE